MLKASGKTKNQLFASFGINQRGSLWDLGTMDQNRRCKVGNGEFDTENTRENLSNDDLIKAIAELRARNNRNDNEWADAIEATLNHRVKNRITQFNESEISEMTKVFGTEPIWHSDDYIGTISDGELQIDIYKLLDGNYKLVYGFKNDFNQYQDYETDTLNDLPELVKIAYTSKKNEQPPRQGVPGRGWM